MRRISVLFLCLSACSASGSRPPDERQRVRAAPVLTAQESGITSRLQAVSAASERVVWASGVGGAFVRTTDGGEHWTSGRVAGADSLEFRDVEAISADTAFLLSAGSGTLSRIYRTVDGGRNWTLQHQNTEPEAFFDCFDFWDRSRGIVFSDAVRGEHLLLETADGGTTWQRVPPGRLPAALPGEGSFASSGTCIAASGTATAWVGMGNTSETRVMTSTDAGRSWSAVRTPIVSGTAAGIGSVVALDPLRAVAMGGEFGSPTARGTYIAITRDGGATWSAGGQPTFAGAVYGASRVPGIDGALVAVGPAGASLSRDGGGSWSALDTLSYWSVDIISPRAGWMVGPGGRIVQIRFQ